MTQTGNSQNASLLMRSLHTTSYEQEGPPSRACFCLRVLPVQREFFLGTIACSGFRLWVSVKCIETIVSVRCYMNKWNGIEPNGIEIPQNGWSTTLNLPPGNMTGFEASHEPTAVKSNLRQQHQKFV